MMNDDKNQPKSNSVIGTQKINRGGRGRGSRNPKNHINMGFSPTSPNCRNGTHELNKSQPKKKNFKNDIDLLINNMSTLCVQNVPNNGNKVSAVDMSPSCIMAPRLSSSKIQKPITVITNIYPLKLVDRIVYRYDVRITVYSDEITAAPKVDLCSGKQDPYRAKKCMHLIQLALRKYTEKKEFAYAYDLSSTLFTNQPLNVKEVSQITISSNATVELQRLFVDSVSVKICITECREFAHTFHTADFQSSITSDLMVQDHALRQFYEILTNQTGLRNGNYFAFGFGRLYSEKEETVNLKRGMELVSGVDKGIRFIDGDKSTGIVPALILDAKKTPLFNEENLMDFASKIFNPNSLNPFIPRLDAKLFQRFRELVGPLISNLRLIQMNNNKTFVATGLSTKPTKNIMCRQMTLVETYERLRIKIRPDLPAVLLKSKYGQAYFPFEVLYVAPHQKVPITKLSPEQTKGMIKNSTVLPKVRYTSITNHMSALHLDECTFNPVLAAFGVKISQNPIKVEANRRVPPQICYRSNSMVHVDADNVKANWNSGKNEFSNPAEIGNFYLFFDDDCEDKVVLAFFDLLCHSARKRGLIFKGRVMKRVLIENLETSIKSAVETSDSDANFFMYIDNKRNAHHKLKLYEILYQVVTQHVKYDTIKSKYHSLDNIISKLNAKNFGHNYRTIPENFAIKKWLSTGDTLVIGYDVCHPEPQTAAERRLNIPSYQPSVVGISFNAAFNPETFIGDYAFHEPRKEQVTGCILEQRIFHILKLFEKMRNKLPKLIVITRDGVSEGQHKMVMMEELEAIRAGIQNYADNFGKINYSPKIVLLVAVKRHNKRFFIETKKGEIANCLPGTVIDHTVTRVDATEIFMQSHKVIKGTGKVPAYTLLVNEANMEMDELQAFINALCYTHQIITSAISLPEPIYQADEWAKRGRNNFRTMYPNESELPRKHDGTVDWNEVTERLCYKGRVLELTRSNA